MYVLYKSVFKTNSCCTVKPSVIIYRRKLFCIVKINMNTLNQMKNFGIHSLQFSVQRKKTNVIK